MTTLIVTIDTEEEGLWSSDFRRDGYTVRNVQCVPRFQQLCEDFGIRPTYLVDTLVVADDSAISVLRAILDAGQCEIGAHLHPWCAPPFEEQISRFNSYLCNLTPSLQMRKLEQLTSDIEDRFGRRPTSFRAGRYGLDIVGARCLDQLGYVVDSSVISYYDYRSEGGPDFSLAPFKPYRTGGLELSTPSDNGKLWEVPVSVGFSQPNFQRSAVWYSRVRHPILRRLHIPGILDRLGLLRKIKFSPEQADSDQMNQLADMYVANDAPCLVMLFHSSSLMAGCSPYVKDEAGLERFLANLRNTFDYCLGKLGMTADTLTGFATTLNGTVDNAATSNVPV